MTDIKHQPPRKAMQAHSNDIQWLSTILQTPVPKRWESEPTLTTSKSTDSVITIATMSSYPSTKSSSRGDRQTERSKRSSSLSESETTSQKTRPPKFHTDRRAVRKSSPLRPQSDTESDTAINGHDRPNESPHGIPTRRSSTRHSSTARSQRRLSHRQATELFQSLDGTLENFMTPTPSPPRPSISSLPPASTNPKPPLPTHLSRSLSTPIPTTHITTISCPAPIHCPSPRNSLSTPSRRPSSIPDQPTTTSIPPPTTVLSWTSSTTRHAEYREIDQAHSGIRGLWKQLMPKCLLNQRSRRGFFDGTCDGDSVRRFRMDWKDEEDAEADEEKRNRPSRHDSTFDDDDQLVRCSSYQKQRQKQKTKNKKWKKSWILC